MLRTRAPKLEYIPVRTQPPEPPKPGAKREKLFEILAGMQVGGEGVEINRQVLSARNYVYRFRSVYGRQLRFMLRKSRPGWTKIWRIR